MKETTLTKKTKVKTKIPTARPKQKQNAVATTKKVVNEHIPNHMKPLIYDILRYCRDHDSEQEKKFGQWLLQQLPEKAFVDVFGNIHYLAPGSSNTIFSSHIDTVHMPSEVTQELCYDPALGHLFTSNGSCLGADDGTGVWIMLQLIRAKVPGWYIFHRGEECGGQGSSWIKQNMSALLSNYDRCIAFDRKGQKDVITHQGTRTCSDKFADALSTMLNNGDNTFKFEKCNGGTFTDSKNYCRLVPECTNISVGYMHQHGRNEFQDLKFLNRLVDTLTLLDWEDLPTARDPLKDNDSRYGGYPQNGMYGHTGYNYKPPAGKVIPPATPIKKTATHEERDKLLADVDDAARKSMHMMERDELLFIVRRFPRVATELLYKTAVTWKDIDDSLFDYYTDELDELDVIPESDVPSDDDMTDLMMMGYIGSLD